MTKMQKTSQDHSKMLQMGNKYRLVSVDHNSGWQEALFLPNPTTDKILEFLKGFIAQNGTPKTRRTDTGTEFKRAIFESFRRKLHENKTRPVIDSSRKSISRTYDENS